VGALGVGVAGDPDRGLGRIGLAFVFAATWSRTALARARSSSRCAAAATCAAGYRQSLCPPDTISMSGAGRQPSWLSNRPRNASVPRPFATNPVPARPPTITCQPSSRAVADAYVVSGWTPRSPTV
jgi:hypothetical protein